MPIQQAPVQFLVLHQSRKLCEWLQSPLSGRKTMHSNQPRVLNYLSIRLGSLRLKYREPLVDAGVQEVMVII